ncbi:MAG: hypothetical protein QG611_789 [Bacteroidota bacterium]|nr:hypothetical protein [Bacteroidota bacterium]
MYLSVPLRVLKHTETHQLEATIHPGQDIQGQPLHIIIQEAIRYLQEEARKAVPATHRDHIIHPPADQLVPRLLPTAADQAQEDIHQDLPVRLPVHLQVPPQDLLPTIHHREAGGKCDILVCVIRSFLKWNVGGL